MMSAALFCNAPPTPEELIGRARDMVPEIRELAEETERNRTISPHIIARIRDAELSAPAGQRNSAASNTTPSSRSKSRW